MTGLGVFSAGRVGCQVTTMELISLLTVTSWEMHYRLQQPSRFVHKNGVNSETDETSQDDTYISGKKFQIGTHFRFTLVAMVTGA